MTKNILISVIEVVLAIFGAFGSFLLKILPEQVSGKEFLYTATQIICVIAFLLIKFLLLKNKPAKFWNWVIGVSLVVCLTSFAAYYLHSKKNLKTVGYSNYKAVNGDLSKEAKETCTSIPYKENTIHQSQTCEEGLLAEASTQDLSWIYTRESVEHNLDIFTILYIVLALSLSITLFSLIELIGLKSNNVGK
jgi:hypothetical protein